MSSQFQDQSSKRSYSNLADYAIQQGIPEQVLVAAGYFFTQHNNRPALQYPTATGYRWRYLDGLEPRHMSESSYKPSWYGLNRAVELSGGHQPLVLVNGAAGVLAAQSRNISAFAVSDGEVRAITPSMLSELQSVWSGEIVIAQDCDEVGRNSTAKRARQLLDSGFIILAVDLQLAEGGDISDFCKIHGDQAYQEIFTLPEIAPQAPKAPIKPFIGGRPLASSDEHAKQLVAAWVDQDLSTLARTTSGRRALLLKMATKVGALTKGGYIAWSEAERGLMDAAVSCGLVDKYGEREIQRTIQDGYRYAGPRVIESRDCDSRNKAKHHEERLVSSDTSFTISLAPAVVEDKVLMKDWGIGLWKHGLPNSVRSALLNYLPKGIALLVEILNAAIVTQQINPQAFTRPELLEAAHTLGYAISERTLFRYMRALEHNEMSYGMQIFFCAMGVATLAKDNSVPILSDLGIETKSITPKSDNNGNLRPREAVVYRLYTPDIQQAAIIQYAYPRMVEAHHPTRGDDPIIAMLHDSMIDGLEPVQVLIWDAAVTKAVAQQDQRQQEAHKRFKKAFKRWQKALTEPKSFELPSDWPLKNHSDYVIAYAHVLGVETEGSNVSQAQWTKWLGISTNSVKSTLHRAGLMEITPRMTVSTLINIDAPNVSEQITIAKRTKRGFPSAWEVFSKDGNLIASIPYRLNMVKEVIQQLQQMPNVQIVTLILELAYTYQVVSDFPVKIEVKPSTTDHQQPLKTTPFKLPLRRAKVVRIPVHDPQWLAEQSRMVMHKNGYGIEDWRFADGDGEIIEAKDHRAIVDIYTTHITNEQRPSQPDQSERISLPSRALEQQMAFEVAVVDWQQIKLE